MALCVESSKGSQQSNTFFPVRSSIKAKCHLEKLVEFLKAHSMDLGYNKGNKITHTSMSKPTGSYHIPQKDMSQFIRLYTEAILSGNRISIVEQHGKYFPIVIDFDFLQSKKQSKRLYDEQLIKNAVKLYCTLIASHLNVLPIKMMAYVMEKKRPVLKNEEYHDGIHIIFPYIITCAEYQKYLRTKFLDLAYATKLFENVRTLNSDSKIVDEAIISSAGWLMYGSVKSDTSLPYRLTHVYEWRNDEVEELYMLQDLEHNDKNMRNYINLLRLRPWTKKENVTPYHTSFDVNALSDYIRKDIAVSTIHCHENTKKTTEEEYNTAMTLVGLLSNDCASHWKTWIRVGLCLHDIDYRLLQTWIEFSKRTTRKNYKEGECNKLWVKMKPGYASIGMLYQILKEDNKEAFDKLVAEKRNTSFIRGLNNTHNDIARIVIERYGTVLRCESIQSNKWYHFHNHRWHPMDSAHKLYCLLSDELAEEYEQYRRHFQKQSLDNDDDDDNRTKMRIKMIKDVIKNLRSSSFKTCVVKECANYMIDENFSEKLNSNPNLLCFDNGVYDLENDVFRDGYPDDFISISTGYDYVEYDPKHPNSLQIKQFFREVQPNKTLRSYLKMVMSTCLAGHTFEESLYIWLGGGGNGKTKTMDLLHQTLGRYYKSMDIMVLTSSRSSSSSATPEIADKVGIRACSADEPKSDAVMNCGTMKSMTGGDIVPARQLFKEPIYFKPQFKLFVLCNNLLRIAADDDGTWRRIKVIRFSSRFIFKTAANLKEYAKKPLPPNTFWADEHITDKLPHWKYMFMGKLIKKYRKYRQYGIIHPTEVEAENDAYRNKCDVFYDFLTEFLEPVQDMNEMQTCADLHSAMIIWHKENYSGKCPSTKDLRQYLTQRYHTFDMKLDALKGFKVRNTTITADDEDIA